MWRSNSNQAVILEAKLLCLTCKQKTWNGRICQQKRVQQQQEWFAQEGQCCWESRGSWTSFQWWFNTFIARMCNTRSHPVLTCAHAVCVSHLWCLNTSAAAVNRHGATTLLIKWLWATGAEKRSWNWEKNKKGGGDVSSAHVSSFWNKGYLV